MDRVRSIASCPAIRDTIEVAATGTSFCGVDSCMGILQSHAETEAPADCRGNVLARVVADVHHD